MALLEENERWYASAGGGDFALLTHCALCAERSDAAGLERVLADARRTGNLEVQVFALDALALLATHSGDLDSARIHLSEADALAPQVAYVVDESDRVDVVAVRAALGV